MTNSLDERAMVASTKSASDSAAGDTIYAIYDALGSLKGELAYIAGKLLGKRKCALCDISHGWNPLGKSSWRHRLDKDEIEVAWLHQDEQSGSLADFTVGRLPMVVVESAEDFAVLLDKQQLTACAGDYSLFLQKLRDALANR